MKKIILTTLSAIAVALCFTACKPEYTTYSGPNYILFSDTLYEMAVVDDEAYYEIPVVATRACAYDRNVAVEVIDAGSNALYTRVTELTFKRHVMSSATGSRLRAAFFVHEVSLYEYLCLFGRVRCVGQNS